MSQDIHHEERMLQLWGTLTSSGLLLPTPSTFNLSKVPTLFSKFVSISAAHCISMNTICVSLLCIWTGAMFWSIAPLLGWGSYTGLVWPGKCRRKWKHLTRTESFALSLDRGYGTCEVDWAKANYSTIHKSYIISILIFCFFIPVMIMLSSYISIIKTVKNTNAMSADGFLTDRQRKVERDVTRVGS